MEIRFTQSRGISNRMRGPQKNRAAGSQEGEKESGNSSGHPINFGLAETFLELNYGCCSQKSEENLNYLLKMTACTVLCGTDY